MPFNLNLLDLLRDGQFRSDVGRGLTDSVNRGAVAGLLGGPVDAMSGVVNAGLMGLGYAGNKLGLLSAGNMPQPIQKPVGGSEWIGDLLHSGGMVSENRNAPAELLAGLLAPSAVKGASKAAFAAENNAMAPTPINDSYRNQAGMFIGPKSKTWNEAQAQKAQQLEAAGVDPRKIWSDTGTFKGPDGMWRQEISDNTAKRIGVSEKSLYESLLDGGKLGQSISHKQLFDAYPINKMSVSKYPGIGAEYGRGYSKQDIENLQKLGVKVDPVLEEKMRFGVNTGFSDLLHEIQHAIQTREGFTLGGNAKSMGGKESDYLRLAGEAEARATQARMSLDEARRRALFPLDSYDVPLDQLIIRR